MKLTKDFSDRAGALHPYFFYQYFTCLSDFLLAKEKIDQLEQQVEELNTTIQEIKIQNAEEIRELEQKSINECKQIRALNHFLKMK